MQNGVRIRLTQWDASVAMLSLSSLGSTALTPLSTSLSTSLWRGSSFLGGVWEARTAGSSSMAAAPESQPFRGHSMAPTQEQGAGPQWGPAAGLRALRGGRRCLECRRYA